MNASAEVKCLTTRHTADKVLHESVQTAVALHNTASEQRASANTKDCENILTDKVVCEAKFQKIPKDMQTNIDLIQASLNNEVKRANVLDSKRVKLLVSEYSIKRQMQLLSEDSLIRENLKYGMDGTVAKNRRSQTINQFLQEQLPFIQSNVKKHGQRFHLYLERFTVDVTESFSGFLYSLGT